MDNMYYTDERNTQIVISLLKANNIKNIITSPGTTHMCFVGSVQHDPFFNVYSCVDERSAAYMACGLAAESGQPVVITCTGATASRNYFSALTEAYYRKLPVIAITAHQGTDRLGHLLEQNIDRRQQPFDLVKLSVEAIVVENERDEHYCTIEVNKAILECTRHGGGPVHINLFTKYSRNFSIKELPPVQVISRYNGFEDLPELPKGRIAIVVGSHRKFSEQETKLIDRFCSTHNSVVFCDHTSGYNGKYKVIFSLCLAQRMSRTNLANLDLLIHIGEVSGNSTLRSLKFDNVWRVNEDGEIRDTFGKLSKVFEMPESVFFDKYSKSDSNENSYLKSCISLYDTLYSRISELPLSTIWVAKQIAGNLPDGCNYHMGIWSSLRAFNYFETNNNTYGNCNVGGFGIDGNLSSLIGASLYNPNKLYIGIIGDLSFFYDMNALGNKHVGNNLRLLVINNGQGNEMRYSFSPASSLGNDGKIFLAAEGHFGNKSRELIKHYSEDLGYKYMAANTKEEFLANKDYFLSSCHYDNPIVFEVFVNDEKDEEEAYQLLTGIEIDKNILIKNKAKETIKSVIGDTGVNIIKKIIKR